MTKNVNWANLYPCKLENKGKIQYKCHLFCLQFNRRASHFNGFKKEVKRVVPNREGQNHFCKLRWKNLLKYFLQSRLLTWPREKHLKRKISKSWICGYSSKEMKLYSNSFMKVHRSHKKSKPQKVRTSRLLGTKVFKGMSIMPKILKDLVYLQFWELPWWNKVV